jgi:hypothetical protein
VTLLSMMGVAGSLWAAESAAPAVSASPSKSSTVVALTYTEVPYGVNNEGVSMTERAEPFKHEPASTGKVIRGTLNFGGSNTNTYAFLWRFDEGKLALDLNQNQDLTDDPAGTLSRQSLGPLNYQTFTNVHLKLRSAAGICPVVTDLHFWHYGYGSRPGCSAELHSFWQGQVTLAGVDWQVGLVPNFWRPMEACDGDALLLRPWSRHQEAFSGSGSTFDAPIFARKVFFGGHAYELHWRPGAETAQMKPSLEFTEQAVTLGEARLTGQFVKRIILSGDYLSIFDQPAASVKLPTGSYSQSGLLLEKDGAQAYPTVESGARSLKVTAQSPTVLAVGGPLTNSVTATRRGEDLVLNYQIIGAGGQTYQMANVNRLHPPEFAIYKGERKIASGNFEFG